MTTSAIASATPTEIQRYGTSIATQATNFFIIACSILGVFVVCTACCCLSLRYRKRRMQRIVTAAFEQTAFQHAQAGERVNASRRGPPVVQVREVVERPQLYEVWQHEHSEWPTTSHISRPPVHWSEYKPMSASVSDPNAIDSRLSDLPVDTQLAYLFHAKVQLKREWKRSTRPRGSVPPYVLQHGQTPSSFHPHQPKSGPLLRLSVLIAMPVPPVSLGAPAGSEDLMLGVASAPFDDIQFDNDDYSTDYTNDKVDTKPSNT